MYKGSKGFNYLTCRFQIKQLEQLLCGQLCPPAGRCGDCFSLQLRLDSLRVMRSLEGAGLSSPPTDLVYDVPRCL